MSIPSTFRAWLKRRRQERGLTQEQLGELVGYAGQTIAKIEGGQRRPSPQLALRLAEALELPPEERGSWMAAALDASADEHAPAAIAGVPPPPPPPQRELPSFLTPLVGREREQAALVGLLARPDVRLVCILGPGGVGKTRLAIEAGRAQSSFGDGAVFVSLAAVADPALIVPAIGAALGYTFSGGNDLLGELVGRLQEQPCLLILDNLEQLLDPAGTTVGLLEQLLAHTPGVKALATSRERLRVAGEWVLELGGLPAPPPHDLSAPALRLFAEHAERVDRSFRLSAENAGDIAAICGLVDGLPLGIELAAAWLRLLTPAEVAEELRRGLESPQLAPRTLPARHHSLRAVVGQSWQLLSDDERRALCRLAVFRGGFTRVAAAQVAVADLNLLATLVDKSLVQRGTGGRYALHELIRQFADEQLREHADELAATRRRHASYYLRFVGEREQRQRSPEQMAVLAEIRDELENVRAAWSWAAANGMYAELDHAAQTLHWFYAHQHWFEEGFRLFGEALARMRAAADQAGDLERCILGRTLGHYGYLAARVGAFGDVYPALDESYALLADGRDPVGLVRTLATQGMAAFWVGKYGEARRKLEEQYALATRLGDRHAQAGGRTYASILAQTIGEYGEAEQLFEEALAHHRAVGEPKGLIWCITFCSATLLARGRYAEAERLLHESLALSQQIDEQLGMGLSLHILGRAALQQGGLAEAIYFFREALPLLRNSGSWVYAQAFNDLGEALREEGMQDEAGRSYRQGLEAALASGSVPEALRALVGLAAHAAATGRFDLALGLVTRALADEATKDALRHSAAELQQAARAQIAGDEAGSIETRWSALPLGAVPTELGLLAKTS
jgi:predicted ATPase/transcriptional regulator with XRE-family HTH domain